MNKDLKMKVKIFGDSFADNTRNGSPDFYSRSWPSLLAKEKFLQVENYSRAGSGLHWSFNQCLQNSQDCDKIIFVGSHYYRWYLHESFHNQVPENGHHVMSAGGNPDLNTTHKKAVDAAMKFHLYFDNREFEYNSTAVYYQYLRHLFGKDILILQATNFPQEPVKDIPLQLDTDNQITLQDISVHEDDFIFVDKQYRPDVRGNMDYDARNCHITHWHSAMLYDKILNWLAGKEFSLTKKDLLRLNKQEASRMYCIKW